MWDAEIEHLVKKKPKTDVNSKQVCYVNVAYTLQKQTSNKFVISSLQKQISCKLIAEKLGGLNQTYCKGIICHGNLEANFHFDAFIRIIRIHFKYYTSMNTLKYISTTYLKDLYQSSYEVGKNLYIFIFFFVCVGAHYLGLSTSKQRCEK